MARDPVKARRGGQPLPPPVLWVLGLVALALALWGLVKFFSLKNEAEPQRKVQQIAVLRPPPPPPPKPPEKPPEPQKIKEEVKLDEPKPVDEPKPAEQPPEPPQSNPLTGAQPGNGPGDGFGMSGGANRAPTIGGGGGGMSQTLFANGVARHIAQELARLGGLRSIEYRVDVRVWLSRDGRIERSEITRGSGDPDIDRLVAEGLTRIGALKQPLPEGMAQPLRIRVTSADA